MPDTPDVELLEQFARNGSEDAFATLVQRHVGLVHSVALRHTANPQHAEDITQAVFIILARKAGTLDRKTVLAGWLYHTARLTAANWQRTEKRRIRREQEAFMQSQLEESPTENLWRELSPELDQAMASLGTTDRDALVLRYFQNKRLTEVGQTLGMTENAAQKRVHHALDKLRKFFFKRGVTSTASGIANTISTHAIQSVPAALTKSVTAVAVAKDATASTSTITLIKGALKLMAWTKAKTAIVVGAIAVLASGTTTVVVKAVTSTHAEGVFEQIWEHPDSSTMQTLINAPSALLVRPTRYPDRPGQGYWTDVRIGRGVWINATVSELVNFAYHMPPSRTVMPPNLPVGGFDLMETLPRGENDAALQREIQKQFGLVGHTQIRETDAYQLRIKNSGTLKTHASPGGQPNVYGTGGNDSSMSYVFKDQTLKEVASRMEGYFDKPVVEPDDLPGHYDFTFQIPYNLKADDLQQSLRHQLEQFGLELMPSRESVEMLVVEQTN